MPLPVQKAVLRTYGSTRRKLRRTKKRIVDRKEIVLGLRRIGVQPGDLLFVHSSMGSLGQVVGGPNEVIEALLEVLTPEGTLAMPAFSQPYGGMLATLEKNQVFDPEKTPSTVGLIPETFRKRAGVKRSIHPTSSVAAYGKLAAQITGGAVKGDSDFGEGTPLFELKEYGGKILGLGVDLGPVSFYHVMEDVLRDKFPVKVRVDRVFSARVVDKGIGSEMRIRPLNPKVASTRIEKNSWLRMLFTEFLIDRGILKIGTVGEARSWLMNSRDLFDAQLQLLDHGVTIYTTEEEYRASAQANGLVSLVSNYRSAYSDARHNYLEEQVRAVAKDCRSGGFWESDSGTWVRELKWSGSGWSGFVSHDWKYSVEMQEGATQYSLLTGSTFLDNQIRQELSYIHSKLESDGTITGIPDRAWIPEEYEYGAVLSALCLGGLRFGSENSEVSRRVLDDIKVLVRHLERFGSKYDDAYSVILRGYANLLKLYQYLGAEDDARTAANLVESQARTFVRKQERSGVFPLWSETTGKSGVHWQLKVDIALLLSYSCTKQLEYLEAAKRNLEWVTKNLQKANGALKWDSTNATDFFEIHQMLYMIATRYRDNLTKGNGWSPDAYNAWKFLVETNPGLIDMYVNNFVNNGTFFAYRYVDSEGRYQEGKHGEFKGSYEIGYSLWALALNKDMAI